MPGGHFDYTQYKILKIIDKIELEIRNNTLIIDSEIDYAEPRRLSDETIAEFQKGVEFLKIAHTYAQRIDWLLSGNDSEKSFHKRLKIELALLKTF